MHADYHHFSIISQIRLTVYLSPPHTPNPTPPLPSGLLLCVLSSIVSLFDYFVCYICHQPSTRTSCSFTAAMQKMGGTVINLSDMGSTSVTKGESLQDFMRVMERYSDIVVLRHPEKGAVQNVRRHHPRVAGHLSPPIPTPAIFRSLCRLPSYTHTSFQACARGCDDVCVVTMLAIMLLFHRIFG